LASPVHLGCGICSRLMRCQSEDLQMIHSGFHEKVAIENSIAMDIAKAGEENGLPTSYRSIPCAKLIMIFCYTAISAVRRPPKRGCV